MEKDPFCFQKLSKSKNVIHYLNLPEIFRYQDLSRVLIYVTLPQKESLFQWAPYQGAQNVLKKIGGISGICGEIKLFVFLSSFYQKRHRMLVMSLPLRGNASTTMWCAHHLYAVAASPHKGSGITTYRSVQEVCLIIIHFQLSIIH